MLGNSNIIDLNLDEIANLTSQIAGLNSQIVGLNSQVNSLTSQNSSLTNQVNSLTNQNSSLVQQNNSLNSQLQVALGRKTDISIIYRGDEVPTLGFSYTFSSLTKNFFDYDGCIITGLGYVAFTNKPNYYDYYVTNNLYIGRGYVTPNIILTKNNSNYIGSTYINPEIYFPVFTTFSAANGNIQWQVSGNEQNSKLTRDGIFTFSGKTLIVNTEEYWPTGTPGIGTSITRNIAYPFCWPYTTLNGTKLIFIAFYLLAIGFDL